MHMFIILADPIMYVKSLIELLDHNKSSLETFSHNCVYIVRSTIEIPFRLDCNHFFNLFCYPSTGSIVFKHWTWTVKQAVTWKRVILLFYRYKNSFLLFTLFWKMLIAYPKLCLKLIFYLGIFWILFFNPFLTELIHESSSIFNKNYLVISLKLTQWFQLKKNSRLLWYYKYIKLVKENISWN